MRPLLAFVLVISACGADPPPAVPAVATDTSDRFELTFELPRTSWTEAEAITGKATLAFDGPARPIWGSGRSVLGFWFKEVGGPLEMGPAWNMDCGTHELSPDQPLTSPIVKFGGYSEDHPGAAFYRGFYEDPLVHLPAGTWDISALASFNDGLSCSGTTHDLQATVRIEVGR